MAYGRTLTPILTCVPAVATPARGRTLLRERPLNILDHLDVLGSPTHR